MIKYGMKINADDNRYIQDCLALINSYKESKTGLDYSIGINQLENEIKKTLYNNIGNLYAIHIKKGK